MMLPTIILFRSAGAESVRIAMLLVEQRYCVRVEVRGKDGTNTKTTNLVGLTEANHLYETTVQQKLQEGYGLN